MFIALFALLLCHNISPGYSPQGSFLREAASGPHTTDIGTTQIIRFDNLRKSCLCEH
jgi:hypothetical protein